MRGIPFALTGLLLLMSFGALSCSQDQSKKQAVISNEGIKKSEQEQAEEYLRCKFTKCRHVHFQAPAVINLGQDSVVLVYCELPQEEMKALLNNSQELADYESLKTNHVNLKVMKQIGRQLAWWDTSRLNDALCGTISWCIDRGDEGDCLRYAHSTVAAAKLSGNWYAVYLCFGKEMFPSLP